MFKMRQLSLLLITALAWLGATGSLKCADFDVSADFATSVGSLGAWRYGWKDTLGGAITEVTNAKPFNSDNGVPLFAWQLTANDGPSLATVIGSGTAVSAGGQFVGPPGTVWFGPGDVKNFAVFRLTIPSGRGGSYRLESFVQDVYSGASQGDTDFHVVRNGVELFGQFLPVHTTAGYTNVLSLVEGDTVDFVAGRGLDGVGGGSTLKLVAKLTLMANVFDLSSDFPTNSNPGGVWTFGWKTNLTDPVVPFAFSRTVPGDTGTFFVWSHFNNSVAEIDKNISDVTATTGSGQGVYPPGSVVVFAGYNGAGDNYGVVRFTAPSNGLYAINCGVASAFNGPISGDTDFHVIKGSTELFSAQIPASSTTVTNGSGYTNSLALNAGDTLDFAVGRGLDNDISGSGLKIRLTIENMLAPAIAQNPSSQFVRRGSNATFTVTATGEPVLHYQWLFNTAPITGANASNLVFVATNLIQSGSYQVVITNSFGSVTSRVAELQVVAELVRPTITVTAPAAGARLTNVTVLAKGTAGDNSKTIKKVLYQLNEGSWLPATGTTNWSVPLNLAPGTNTFRAYSVDSSGNTSLTNTRTVFRIVKSTLTIASTGTGSGQVVSNLNGKLLEIGVNYSVTATPASNSVFGGWTTNNGSRLFLSQKLTFLMSSNLVLHPIFSLENPFAAGKGLYQGLFSESNNVQHASSGFLSFQLSDKGALSGKVLIDGGTHLFQGRVSLDGQTAFEISRPGKSTLLIALTADLNFGTAGLFTGTVTDGNWTAALTGGRALTLAGQINPGLTGRYTVGFQGSITGAVEDATFPGGFSVGSTTVGTSGLIQFTGTLADGTPVTQGANLNKDGRWPLYIPLYGGKGSMLAWITLDPTGQRNVSGQINWIKPAIAAGRYYPAGFNKQLNLSGSGYVRPETGQKVINLSLGLLTLTGGSMSTQILESLIIGSDNKIAISGVSRPTMTVNLDNGTFSGSFFHPVTRLATPFKGVFVQDETTAIGFFLGPSRSGAVVIGAP